MFALASAAVPSTRPASLRRRLTSAILLSLAAMLGVVGKSRAAHYNVSTTSDLQNRVNTLLVAGDTVIIAAGTYRPTAVLTISGIQASASVPTVLRTDGGEVTIDCSDNFRDSTWTVYSGSIYKATRTSTLMSLTSPPSQVHVDTTRYTYVNDTNYGSVDPTDWKYDAANNTIYVNFGSGGPASHDIFVGDVRRKRGVEVLSSDYVVIDGISVMRAIDKGIYVVGSSTTTKALANTVNNCVAAQCGSQGIQFDKTRRGYITHCTTYKNVSHGIQLDLSDSCHIAGNESWGNENPAVGRDGIVGIEIGNSPTDTTNTSYVWVDNNVVHDNEDTGIEIRGGEQIVVRRNISYNNHDHGFDNNGVRRAAYINNIAFKNEHDGLSIESHPVTGTQTWGCMFMQVYNNILAYNARNSATLATPTENIRELWVGCDTAFVSDYNVIVGLPYQATGGGGYRYLVEWQNDDGTKSFYKDNEFATYQAAKGRDVSSYNTFPAFRDTSMTPDFTIRDGAYTDNVIDAAQTGITGWTSPMWLSVDPHGIGPHDASKTNVGDGSPTDADIGVFEYDPPPAPTPIETAACDPDQVDQWRLDWAAVSDDTVSNAIAVAEYEVKMSPSHITTETDWSGATSLGGPSPGAPGYDQAFWVQALQTEYFSVRGKDANGHWSALSTDIGINPATDTAGCTFGWYGGGGGGGGGGCGRFCDGGLVAHAPTPTSLRRPGAGVDTASVGENTILNATSTGARGEELLPIEAVQNAAGLYLAHLRATRGHGALVDGIKLLFVDHPAGTEAFAYGSTVVAGHRSQTSHAVTETGADVTKLVNGTGGIFNASDAVAVTISTPLDSLQTPLVIECANGGMRGHPIIVESRSPSGWREIGAVYPRRAPSSTVIDSVPAGPIRLRFTGYAWVSSVARLARETANVSRAWGGLEGARSASTGDVSATIGAEDTVATTLVGPDTLWAVFSGPPLGQNLVRSAFLGISATPVTASAAINAAARSTSSIPTRFALYQNVPNPFWGSTTIRLDLPVGRMVRLEIFDVSGRRVRTLVNHFMPAGRQSLTWNQRDDAGAELGAGVYFARVQVDTFRDRKKLILMP